MANFELTSEELIRTLELTDLIKCNVNSKEESEYIMVAPPVDNELNCTLTSFDVNVTDTLHPLEEQLQYLLHKADEFQTHLVYSQDCSQNENFAHVVSTFLRTCQPYFTYFESTARNTSPGTCPLSTYVRTQLLQFSQQLCNRLEQLALKCASFGYLSLEETDPLGVSHFYIGQCHVDNIKLSVFRYFLPCPFLASAYNGLYKRMRWNVELQRKIKSREDEEETYRRTERAQRGQREQREKLMEGQERNSTEYYFMCCEDDHVAEEALGEKANKTTEEKTVKMWSIGQWVQTYPDPSSEDIYNWVLCLVPQGEYRQLVCLGKEEPSACIATDCLLGVLLSQGDPAIIHTTALDNDSSQD
ncbi:UPF0575 protein C19orf67 homolog [Trichomycterus rosablanca]|uniref:UPF0575 protein C19orf67 homolog n=1 Tax=Trichomycterus rosablanca TaxID=2290929 RepID=UPI002F354917